MKFINILLSFFLFASCASGKEKIYTGSTPTGTVVKSFLGIPLPDSIDFCRWKLFLNDDNYRLECNYGISKPNTNGFMNGGKKIEIAGVLKKDKSIYQLTYGNKILKLAELNADLLHLLDNGNQMLVGNDGWSYTLSNITPANTGQSNIVATGTVLKDSMTFTGRTPCPGIDDRSNCYKLKWTVVLYADAKTNQPAGCRIRGTINEHIPKTGSWKIITAKDGRIMYHLNSENKKPIYFVKMDENILLFTDADGKLLVGNEDFSYTLNRK